MTPARAKRRVTLVLDRRFPGVGRIKKATGTTLAAASFSSNDTTPVVSLPVAFSTARSTGASGLTVRVPMPEPGWKPNAPLYSARTW